MDKAESRLEEGMGVIERDNHNLKKRYTDLVKDYRLMQQIALILMEELERVQGDSEEKKPMGIVNTRKISKINYWLARYERLRNECGKE